ncbi:MAG: HEAT repeat domain-containing protein [Chloroflexia bacterium]
MFLKVLAGLTVGLVAALLILLLWVPQAAQGEYRPAVLSTVVLPLGLFLGWLLSGSRSRAPTAAATCFALYFLSAFAAARIRTFLPAWDYFYTVSGVQAVGGLALAVGLGFHGRGLPQVERLRAERDTAGLVALLRRGNPEEQREAARALGEIGHPEGRPALLEALKAEDLQVRRAAAEALIGLATAEDVPVLAAALESPDPILRRRVREALRWVEGGEAAGRRLRPGRSG